MSLDLESRLRAFLASAPQTVHPVQTLEISHSAMSQTFHLWREPYAGTTSVAGVARAMRPVNFEIKLAGSEGHLDQKFSIAIDTVDPDNTLRNELDRIPVATLEKIVIVYREFLSDDLTAPQATARLQVEAISYVKGAANLTAVSPRLNMLRTGETYTPKDIPMLRGFL
ncbi:DUF1833 family protein [Polaromonas sp. CG_23.6]|uniref:DUF1833 family protein n=1 Tax=Polaromonas sp. CG_23.6 TaxID=2760709 RepID=UPI0024754222|nr:DUF1833 family protein [Polaromonas sp. CG_23.6]MDH6185476.1 hypothetical protein [Polaromonas sp. CG_23.6]